MDAPSIPKMPPTVTKNVLSSDLCVIHKGTLSEEIYVCKCGANMCISCAKERKNSTNRLCPVCSSVIFVK